MSGFYGPFPVDAAKSVIAHVRPAPLLAWPTHCAENVGGSGWRQHHHTLWNFMRSRVLATHAQKNENVHPSEYYRPPITIALAALRGPRPLCSSSAKGGAGFDANMCCQYLPAGAMDPVALNAAGIGNYELGDEIGSGMFSVVREATHRLTREKVAVKVMSHLNSDPAAINQEIRAMKLVKGHPHVVNLFEVIQDAENTYLVMEYCEQGTMDDYLMKHGKVSESRARLWTHQLVTAVQHCHANRVVHMDIKPANIYLDFNHNLKLGDFGLAVVTIDAYTEALHQPAGSPVYAAPEVYRVDESTSFVGPVAAVWAIGTVLHTMLARSLPFTVEHYPDDCPAYTAPPGVSEHCADLLKSLMNPDPLVRPSENDILQHPWMTQDSSACCCECPCTDTDDTHSIDSAGSNGSGSSHGDPDLAMVLHRLSSASTRDSAESASPSPRHSPPPTPSRHVRHSISPKNASTPRHRHLVCGRPLASSARRPSVDVQVVGSDHAHDGETSAIEGVTQGAETCRERAAARMRELGFSPDVVKSASRSSAVFDHAAATFLILLASECRLAHMPESAQA